MKDVNVHIDATVRLQVSDEIAAELNESDEQTEESVTDEAWSVLSLAWSGSVGITPHERDEARLDAIAKIIFSDSSVEVL